MNEMLPPGILGYDEKDFVVIRRIEDITSRPDFLPEIDLVADPIVQPLGSHPFQMRCGRKGCHSHRDHHRGHLVRTRSGKTTVIGWQCGEELLGKDAWGRFTNYVDTRDEQLSHREILRTTATRIPELRAAVHEMRTRTRGLDWLERSMNGFAKHGPRKLLDNLRQRSKIPLGDAIHEDVKLTDQERQDRKATGTVSGRDNEFSRKLIGRLKGLDVFKKMPDSVLWKGVLEPLKILEELGADNVPLQDLARLAKRCGEIDQHLREADARLTHAQQFFTEENFALFARMHLETNTRLELARFKWDFDAGNKM